MNANASAIATPSTDRKRRAASNVARGEASCFARVPLKFAGERRKILDIGLAKKRFAARLYAPIRASGPPSAKAGLLDWRFARSYPERIPV